MEDAARPLDVPQVSDEVVAACEEAVTALFPEICRDYLSGLARTNQWNSEIVLAAVLDAIDVKGSYPKRTRPNLKRKRESDASQTEAISPAVKYSSDAHKQAAVQGNYPRFTDRILREHFRFVPVRAIQDTMTANNLCLYPSFMALEKAVNEPAASRSINLKKTPTPVARYSPEKADDLLQRHTLPDEERAALVEYKAAMSVINDERAKKEEEARKQREEDDHLEKARAAGTVFECECCCDDFAMDRMIHCNGDETHWFCVGCSRRNAETQIGLSKYQLTCMSMDGCTAEFSSDQVHLFVDEKTKLALDRIEQETVLRLAGFDDLETCPSCPFAAILPPVEVDKEFRCLNPECEMVSCRLCKKDTHIPRTCAEAAKDQGHSARRVIEEAMSEAMIRRCNKCAMPFVKESGCNKMTCSRPGCRNIQCYVCSKSCDYAHFNDASRGGKSGNCPLFDQGQVDDRHAEEVQKAEEAARLEVAANNPEVDAELLGFQFSDKVKADEERRKARYHPQGYPQGGIIPGHLAAGQRLAARGRFEQAYRRQQVVPAPVRNQAAERAAGWAEQQQDLFGRNREIIGLGQAANPGPVNLPQQLVRHEVARRQLDHLHQAEQRVGAQIEVLQARARLIGRMDEARGNRVRAPRGPAIAPHQGALEANRRQLEEQQQNMQRALEAHRRQLEEQRENMLQQQAEQDIMARFEAQLAEAGFGQPRQGVDANLRAAPAPAAREYHWQHIIPVRNGLQQPEAARLPRAYQQPAHVAAPSPRPQVVAQPNRGGFDLYAAGVPDQIQENMRLLDQQLPPALPAIPQAEDFQLPNLFEADAGLALDGLALIEPEHGRGEQAPGQSAENPYLLDDDDNDLEDYMPLRT